MSLLKRQGWTQVKRVGLFSCEGSNADVSLSSYGRYGLNDPRNNQEYYQVADDMALTAQDQASNDAPVDGNVDLRHLAYQLAWYVYTLNGPTSTTHQPVDIVTYGMGGLIVRWMLYAEQHTATIGFGLFPPALVVSRIVAVSPPFDGYLSLPEPVRELAQMNYGDTLITDLRQYSGLPQGTGGTDWTLIANYPHDLTVDSGTADIESNGQGIAMGPLVDLPGSSSHIHKVIYVLASDPTGTGPYPKGEILEDSSNGAVNAITCDAQCPLDSCYPSVSTTTAVACTGSNIFASGSSSTQNITTPCTGGEVTIEAPPPTKASPEGSPQPTATQGGNASTALQSRYICLGDRTGTFKEQSISSSVLRIVQALT
jgi:hypothetical protein